MRQNAAQLRIAHDGCDGDRGCDCRPGARRSGAILIISMLVTFAMCAMVLTLCEEMRVESITAGNRAAEASALAVERGGEQYAIAILSDPTQSPFDLAEDQFTAIQVGDGYFWIVRPDYDDQTLPLYGLTDEAGKINLNSGTDAIFQNILQGDTDTISAVESWRSATASEDDSSYSMLPDPYQPPHAKYENVEELLMVRNMTRTILYGDGTAAPLGTRTNVMAQPSANQVVTDGQLSRGLFDLFTVYSKEPTAAPDGGSLVPLNATARGSSHSRINVSGLRKLFSQLGATGATSALGKISSRTTLVDIFDLYNRGGMKPDDLDAVADYIAAPSGVTSRIDVNTAPPAILYSLVGVGSVTASDIDKLVAQRQSLQPEQGQIGWVADTLKQDAVGLGRYITGRTYQYSADIVAVSGNGRAFKHCRVVIDASAVPTGGAPQIIYRRDISDRGWPMDPQILSDLRAGRGVGAAGGATSGTNLTSLGGLHG